MVLVLALAIVLGMLILQFGLTARAQLAQARFLLEKSRAEVEVHSLEAALLFSLLTEVGVARPPADSSGVPRMNFEGEPFALGGYTVRVQDMSGLFSMPSPGAPTRDFEGLLITLGLDADQARAVGKRLFEAQVSPKRFPLQTFSEVAVVTGLDGGVINRLEAISSFYPSTIFNPLTAPKEVLAARYGRDIGDFILRERRERQLNELEVQRIIGQDIDLLTSLLIGPGFRLEVAVQVGDATLIRRSEWTVYPSSVDSPLTLWSRQGVDPAVD